MEGYVNKGFPLTTSKAPSLSGGSNENELNFDELSSKLHQAKKPLTKHFMAPTISAATKAAAATVTRKKILTDRNECSNLFDTHLQKTPNLLDSSMTSQIKSPSKFVRSSSFRLTSSHNSDDEDQNTVASDSSLKPYDPVSSYTSPRPKFLRYNPNRLQRQQNKTCKEEVKLEARTRMSFDSEMGDDALHSVVSSSQESPRKEEEIEVDDKSNGDQEIVDHEEEIEEIEERGLSLKDMLKFVLVVVALLFSTLYIVSMNSSNPSPVIEALQGLKNGYYGIQDKVFEVVNRKIFEGINEPFSSEVEIFEGINEPFSSEVERKADAESEERRVEGENWGLRGGNQELGEVVEVENVKIDEVEPERKWEVFDQLVAVTEIPKKEDVIVPEFGNGESIKSFQDHHVIIGEVVEGVFRDEEIKKSDKESDEFLEIETAETFKSFQEHQVISDEEIKKSDEESDEFLETETAEMFKSFQDHRVIGEEAVKVEENEEESETVRLESDLNKTIINKLAMIESIPKYIIAVTMSIFTILASVGLYWYKKTSSKDYPQLAKESIAESCETRYQKPHSTVEKITPVLHVEQEKIKKIEFKAKPSALIRSNEEEKETSKEFCSLSQAPLVELLNELVIGEVSSSRGAMINKLLEIEESKITTSSSLGGEFSAVDSTSYGSFTTEKKITKKEEAKDGEVNMLITPVRRSSRIRNRAVMSP